MYPDYVFLFLDQSVTKDLDDHVMNINKCLECFNILLSRGFVRVQSPFEADWNLQMERKCLNFTDRIMDREKILSMRHSDLKHIVPFGVFKNRRVI